MGQFHVPPSLDQWFKEVRGRLQILETAATPIYTTATRPSTPIGHPIIFVSDGVAGSQFQGWNGTGWVSLG